LDLFEVIEDTFRSKEIINDLLVARNTSEEEIFQLYEPYILDSLEKLNSQIEYNYKKNKEMKGGLQQVFFLTINLDLYKKYKENKINLEDYTDFNDTKAKVMDCILIRNTVLIDPVLTKDMIYTYLN
jgi:hypothetical protein